jgi:UTP--glucose-1-phosphate uridylyltransferase
MKLTKAVIAAAGLGTRMLPATKELPKEMLPIFSKGSAGISLKPTLQLTFEQLYNNGLREFCFIVGRGKRSVEDHFTPDWRYVDDLKKKDKNEAANDLENFYEMIETSTLLWLNQPRPKGFGHAVLLSKPFIGDDNFLVAAGDTYIKSKDDNHIRSLINSIKLYSASLLLKKTEDPRMYGIAILEGSLVKKVVEKPSKWISDYAIMPFYTFKPTIFNALKNTPPGKAKEIQLTDAIQGLIDSGEKATAFLLDQNDVVFDVGTPHSYWEALKKSHELFSRENQ